MQNKENFYNKLQIKKVQKVVANVDIMQMNFTLCKISNIKNYDNSEIRGPHDSDRPGVTANIEPEIYTEPSPGLSLDLTHAIFTFFCSNFESLEIYK